MLTGRRGGLPHAINRALTGAAILAQFVMIAAPLIDARDVDTGGSRPAAVVAASGAVVSAGESGQLPPHNPATCPACIAQSLHAQVAPVVSLPAFVVSFGVRPELRTAAVPQHDPPSSHQSRAPPVVS